MTATLVAMAPAIAVLAVTGIGTLALGWWLSVVSEGRDQWLTGEDQ